jgi:hypothetical protein
LTIGRFKNAPAEQLTPRPIFDIGHRITVPEQILLSQEHLPDILNHDRERVLRARQAAEALFASKPPVTDPQTSTATTAGQIRRQPRVRPVIRPLTRRDDRRKAPITVDLETTSSISKSDFARIRTWLKYGMTVRQAADLYKVSAASLSAHDRTRNWSVVRDTARSPTRAVPIDKKAGLWRVGRPLRSGAGLQATPIPRVALPRGHGVFGGSWSPLAEPALPPQRRIAVDRLEQRIR